MTKYSAFDRHLGKICNICNKRSAKTVINAIKKVVSTDGDIEGLTDNEIFSEWGYILFSHTKRVVANLLCAKGKVENCPSAMSRPTSGK